jgi:hypothetical protein
MSKRICQRKGCGNELQTFQHKYCSKECGYEVKKESQISSYKRKADELKFWMKMEKVLEFWYKVSGSGRDVFLKDLNDDKFIYGVSQGKKKIDGRLYDLVGKFAYIIENEHPFKVCIILCK